MSNSLDTREKIVIGGAARSGSTYLQYLLTSQYKESGLFVRKTHLELDHLDRVKNPDNEETWIVPIRKPKNTAKSILAWATHKDSTKFLDEAYVTTTPLYGTLDSITRLWETMLLDKHKFIFLDFDFLISNKKYVQSKLEFYIPRLLKEKHSNEISEEEIKEKLETDDKNRFSTEPEYLNMGHLPRKKSEIYEKLEILFESDIYVRRFQYLNSLYSELVSWSYFQDKKIK